jgi:NAD(P)-dependent dehydrogenase (short-subunit alcohol dehydrogenase family)
MYVCIITSHFACVFVGQDRRGDRWEQRNRARRVPEAGSQRHRRHLTARDETRGAASVEKLRGLGLCDVIFHQLEVTDTKSVAQLADFLKTTFGKLDILVTSSPNLTFIMVTKEPTNELASKELALRHPSD